MGLVHLHPSALLCPPWVPPSQWGGSLQKTCVLRRKADHRELRVGPNLRAFDQENSLKLQRMAGSLLEWMPQGEVALSLLLEGPGAYFQGINV